MLSIDAEKSISQSRTHIHDKNLQQVGLEGTYVNPIKALCEKATANIILNGRNVKDFPLQSQIK